MAFRLNGPGKEYAIQTRSDASLAYFKHAHAVWLAITPSDFLIRVTFLHTF